MRKNLPQNKPPDSGPPNLKKGNIAEFGLGSYVTTLGFLLTERKKETIGEYSSEKYTHCNTVI